MEITGEGTYTIGLDFTGMEAGSANGTGFSALAVSSGELLFPGYAVTIKEILINGKPYEWQGKPYTASDDGKCTRVNLYNGWVKDIPSEARTEDGNLTDATAFLLDNEKLGRIETLFITFDYREKRNNFTCCDGMRNRIFKVEKEPVRCLALSCPRQFFPHEYK